MNLKTKMNVRGKHGKTQKPDAVVITTAHPVSDQHSFPRSFIPCPFVPSVDTSSPFPG